MNPRCQYWIETPLVSKWIQGVNFDTPRWVKLHPSRQLFFGLMALAWFLLTIFRSHPLETMPQSHWYAGLKGIRQPVGWVSLVPNNRIVCGPTATSTGQTDLWRWRRRAVKLYPANVSFCWCFRLKWAYWVVCLLWVQSCVITLKFNGYLTQPSRHSFAECCSR